jgi:hypothetical protein
MIFISINDLKYIIMKNEDKDLGLIKFMDVMQILASDDLKPEVKIVLIYLVNRIVELDLRIDELKK